MSTSPYHGRPLSSSAKTSRVLVLSITEATQIVNANVIYQIASPHGVVSTLDKSELLHLKNNQLLPKFTNFDHNTVGDKVFVDAALSKKLTFSD